MNTESRITDLLLRWEEARDQGRSLSLPVRTRWSCGCCWAGSLAFARRSSSHTTEGKTIQLVEEFLVRRFPNLDREEIRAMFQLEDLRKTRVWQQAREEGREEGQKLAKSEFVHKCLAKGMPVKEIAALLDTSVQEVRRLGKNGRP